MADEQEIKAVVEVGDINIEMQDSEDLDEFAGQIVVDSILTRVFEFLKQKQELDSKRKTWNLKY